MKPNASWSQVVTALNNIQMTTAADAISKRYIIYKTGKLNMSCDYTIT